MSKEFNRKIGKMLKEKRTKKRMTQQQVADRLGITRSAYGYYETGRTAVDIETFKAICQILYIDPYEFLREIL